MIKKTVSVVINKYIYQQLIEQKDAEECRYKLETLLKTSDRSTKTKGINQCYKQADVTIR